MPAALVRLASAPLELALAVGADGAGHGVLQGGHADVAGGVEGHDREGEPGGCAEAHGEAADGVERHAEHEAGTGAEEGGWQAP